MSGSEIRYAWRALQRQRGASLLVVGMLALAIAANVAVFSLIDGLFLRPFPYPRRIASCISTTPPRAGISTSSASTIRTSIAGARTRQLFESMAALRHCTVSICRSRQRRRARRRRGRSRVDFPRVLGVEPLLGPHVHARGGQTQGAAGRALERRSLARALRRAIRGVVGGACGWTAPRTPSSA